MQSGHRDGVDFCKLNEHEEERYRKSWSASQWETRKAWWHPQDTELEEKTKAKGYTNPALTPCAHRAWSVQVNPHQSCQGISICRRSWSWQIQAQPTRRTWFRRPVGTSWAGGGWPKSQQDHSIHPTPHSGLAWRQAVLLGRPDGGGNGNPLQCSCLGCGQKSPAGCSPRAHRRRTWLSK